MSYPTAFTRSMMRKRAQDISTERSRSRSTSVSSSNSSSSLPSSTPAPEPPSSEYSSLSTFSSLSSSSPPPASPSSSHSSSSSSSDLSSPPTAISVRELKQEQPELEPEVTARIERIRRRLGPMRPDLEFEVERILDVREGRNGALSYLVHWRGYPPSEDSWERERNLRCEDLLEEFYRTRGDTGSRREASG